MLENDVSTSIELWKSVIFSLVQTHLSTFRGICNVASSEEYLKLGCSYPSYVEMQMATAELQAKCASRHKQGSYRNNCVQPK
jgi:hypothetical protein